LDFDDVTHFNRQTRRDVYPDLKASFNCTLATIDPRYNKTSILEVRVFDARGEEECVSVPELSNLMPFGQVLHFGETYHPAILRDRRDYL
jgi:hypothetical protein